MVSLADYAPMSTYSKAFAGKPHSIITGRIPKRFSASVQQPAPTNLIDEQDFRKILESERFTQFADAVAQLLKPIYDADYQWDSTPVGRWQTLTKSVPAMVTRGSVVVERGMPHFKGAPLAECPRCKTKLTHGTATLTFRHAPPATQMQRVEAWVCSCGEFYVPGKIAKEAHLRAFGRDRYPLRGSVLCYERPTEPVAAADWEALE
jgi:hypothetical protein